MMENPLFNGDGVWSALQQGGMDSCLELTSSLCRPLASPVIKVSPCNAPGLK